MAKRNILSRLAAAASRPFRNEFDGGRQRRRLRSWQPTQNTVNVILSSSGNLLRARCRDALRNNPFAVAACDSFVANLIGTGIKPSSLLPEQPDLREAIMNLWLEWTDQCDADGLADFYGMQTIVARSLFEAGECFIRFRSRRPDDGMLVPLQIQLLESDMCPYMKNEVAPNGNFIMNGIELDFRGKRVAYWFYPVHPGDLPIETEIGSMAPVRVPASEVLHIFRCTRPGQMRGVPLITPALVRMYLLDQYDDAELDRKRIAACFAGFISAAEPIFPSQMSQDKDVDISDVEPGTFQYLRVGEDIKFSQLADVGGTYEAYQYRNQLALFAALGIPYSLATSDLRRANYSSLRGSIVEYRRKLEQFQHNVFVFQMCEPIWRRWMDTAILAEAIGVNATVYLADKTQYQKARWIPHRNEWVDPLKDRQAEKLAVDSGFKSRSDVVEAEGFDPEENDKRIAADHEREQELGLQFQTIKGGTTDAEVQAEADQKAADAAQQAADEASSSDSQAA